MLAAVCACSMGVLASLLKPSCSLLASPFAELMSVEHMPALSLTWCTLVHLSTEDLPHVFPGEEAPCKMPGQRHSPACQTLRQREALSARRWETGSPACEML